MKYGDKIDTLARQRFSEFEKVKDEYEKAKKAHSDNPVKTGWGVTPEYLRKAQRLQLDYEEAQEKWIEAQKTFRGLSKELSGIRNELVEDIRRKNAINPSDLDRNVVDVLTAGMCSPEEIRDLYDKTENATTRRYIANYAKSEVERINASNLDAHEKRRRGEVLNNLTAEGASLTDPEKDASVRIFDSVADVANRCINNPAMISRWGDLVSDALSEI